MAITQYYVRPVNGANVAGQGTSHATAYLTLQFALDDIGGTHGQGARGDQINLCDEGANVNAAALSLAAYGVPAVNRPLIIRGYTTVANDGGIGEIDCNGVTMWLLSTYGYINLVDLEIHSPGNNHLIYLGTNTTITRCYLHHGVSAPVNKYCLYASSDAWTVTHCYIPTFGTGNSRNMTVGNGARVMYNYLVSGGQMGIVAGDVYFYLVGNLMYVSGAWGVYSNASYAIMRNNVIYASAGNTGAGIRCSGARYLQSIYNNIIANFSGVGGIGVDLQSEVRLIIGNNALYNNTSNYGNVAEICDDRRGDDIALVADPFANAAAGNFMLTAAAQALLRSVGWPGQYLGATLTDSQLTVGPVQYGEGGGGSVSISPWGGNIG